MRGGKILSMSAQGTSIPERLLDSSWGMQATQSTVPRECNEAALVVDVAVRAMGSLRGWFGEAGSVWVTRRW